MKIIDRYVFFSFVSIFLFCTVFLYVLFIIGDVFGFLDEILRERIGITVLASFYFYMMPFVITQIAPISCLLSSVFLLGNLNKYNEITALKASGVSLLRIIRPLLIGASLIGALIFILNDRIAPTAMQKANKIRYESLEVGKRGRSKSVIMKNIAIYGLGKKIIFVKEFNVTENILQDVIIHTHDESQNIISKISVKSMLWKDKRWLGNDVVIYNIDKKGQFIGNPQIFNEREIPLKETPLDFVNNQWQPQFMGYMQLKRYLDVFLAGSKLAKRRFTVDLYYKLSFPFSCLIMILIASPFTLERSRGKALLGMAKGILIALTYIPFVAISLALGKGGLLPPFVAAWLANIVLGSIGLYFALKH